MTNADQSLSIIDIPGHRFGWIQKAGLTLLAIGLVIPAAGLFGVGRKAPELMGIISIGLITAGTLIFIIQSYLSQPEGVSNNRVWFSNITSRRSLAWVLAVLLTSFYILLYWYEPISAAAGVNYFKYWIRVLDPVSMLLRGKPADQWFMYGAIYTFLVCIMGIRALLKYRHSRYHVIRTFSVMFFQLGFAFLLPALLQLFNQPEFYFSYFWPLHFSYLFPGDVHWLMRQPGGLGTFMVFWGAMMTFIATPVLTYFYGKRWYCSWVCGCGGLANTAGDPFRHLSDKSTRAWRIERITVYSCLVFISVTTILLWINSIMGGAILGSLSGALSRWYGFYIGGIFSGVIGVGFYPIMGTRVWCRFGCPMAAYLGILQKYFSRFRITTNGGQCISCGNCSTYCEMGIDVRAYAQRGENIVRASCVGCGMCSTVCPRGVLNLENGPVKGRIKNAGQPTPFNAPLHS